MRVKAIYAVGALLAGALLVWSCDARESNTGGLNSPCSSDSECGSGLVCAVNLCSNGRAGRLCSDSEHDCIGGLVCNGARCGGVAGDQCVGDSHCATELGFICARVDGNPACTMRGNGRVGSPCRESGHCRDPLVCNTVVGRCAQGVDAPCSNDDECGELLICAGPAGARVCSLFNRSAGSACSTNDHCDAPLVCGDTGTCGTAAESTCQIDSQCAGSLICASGEGGQACASSNGMTGDPCRIGDIGDNVHCDGALVCGDNGTCGTDVNGDCFMSDDQCAGSLICTGVIGSQVCQSSHGVLDSLCGDDSHCNGNDLVCNSGICKIREGRTCAGVEECTGSLRCNRMMGILQCSTAGDDTLDSVCGFHDHCDRDDDLICSGGACKREVNAVCSENDDCADSGNVICSGMSGMKTCIRVTGSPGSVCSDDTDCSGTHATCISNVCKVTSGGGCGGDDQCVSGTICITADQNSATICTESDGSIGSSCSSTEDHCTGSDKTCEDGTCKVRPAHTCTADSQCTSGLSCTGIVGSQTCNTTTRNTNGQCGNDAHCGPGLVCGTGGECAMPATVWTAQISNVDSALHDIHYGGGLWVAVGGTHNVAVITTSENGTTWTAQTGNADLSGINVESPLNAVHHANGLWVVGGGVKNFVFTSDDGAAWTTRDSSGTRPNDIYYANRLWVAVDDGGDIITSTNGTTWTRPTIVEVERAHPDDPDAEYYIEGILNAVHYATDDDGNNGLWVAVGHETGDVTTVDGDMTEIEPAGVIITSTNSTTWTKQAHNVTTPLVDIHHANNRWVAVGNDGVIITSANGTTWAASVDDKGTPDTSDDTNWTDNALLEVHYDNNTWVAVGGGGSILTSTNGTTWAVQNSRVSDTLHAVHYDNGVWAAVGDNGTIITSTDGTTWAIRTNSNVSERLTDVHYANGLWVGIGADGVITTAR